jgi:succinyl-CoA synthetase alpha subunit
MAGLLAGLPVSVPGVTVNRLCGSGLQAIADAARMIAAGTTIVAGVTPGKGGQSIELSGVSIPVYNSVTEAVAATGADVSVVFVPPKFASYWPNSKKGSSG